ncbi:MAG: hypothetical protein Ct9H300mP12_06270 [Acidimicrobiales bacterium]|nr:MAG: hypothetical protein Ct9H300mP12_06270 [Acidimicrobiales bacterium]
MDETSIRINHSCDANVGFRGQVLYVAMRDIAIDEELCHDYAMAGPMTTASSAAVGRRSAGAR